MTQYTFEADAGIELHGGALECPHGLTLLVSRKRALHLLQSLATALANEDEDEDLAAIFVAGTLAEDAEDETEQP